MAQVEVGLLRRTAVARGGEGVERLADGPVADGVHVHLEAGLLTGDDRLGQRLAGDEGVAPVGGRVAAAVEVGVDHRRGEVLRHAVLHDLHRRRPEPRPGQLLAPGDQVGHLLDAAVAVPPQRTDDVRREVPARDIRRYVGAGSPCRRSRRRSRPARPVTPSSAGSADPRPGRLGLLLGGRPEAAATPATSRPRAACPSGRPSESRSRWPSGGSGVPAATPASSSARLLTQAPWWSRLARKTGRSGTHAVERPRRSGCRRGRRPSSSRRPAPSPGARQPEGERRTPRCGRGSPRSVVSPARSQRMRSRPPWAACTCASTKPGETSPPARSTTTSAATASASCSGSTARTLSSSTTRAWPDRWADPSKTEPPRKTVVATLSAPRAAGRPGRG